VYYPISLLFDLMDKLAVATEKNNSDKPLILAVETSGRLGSVALAQGDKLLSETCFSAPMRHSAEIFPAITGLLSKFNKKPDQIEQVYISAGPGSFTGLRIAVTFAKTLAFANNAKIVAVDTLDCIAANVLLSPPSSVISPLSSGLLAVILDAKRSQFFIAVYENGPDKTWKKILPDSLMTAEEFLTQFSNTPVSLIGEGLVFYKNQFAHQNVSVLDDKFWNPSAANIHKLGWQLAINGQFADPLTLTPNYIRGPDITIKKI
jgi:tRNA threonylcarbamoyladenosine biosynthesis protein TsaB